MNEVQNFPMTAREESSNDFPANPSTYRAHHLWYRQFLAHPYTFAFAIPAAWNARSAHVTTKDPVHTSHVWTMELLLQATMTAHNLHVYFPDSILSSLKAATISSSLHPQQQHSDL